MTFIILSLSKPAVTSQVIVAVALPAKYKGRHLFSATRSVAIATYEGCSLARPPAQHLRGVCSSLLRTAITDASRSRQ